MKKRMYKEGLKEEEEGRIESTWNAKRRKEEGRSQYTMKGEKLVERKGRLDIIQTLGATNR